MLEQSPGHLLSFLSISTRVNITDVNLRSKIPPRLQKFTTQGALLKLPMLPPALLVVGILVLLRPFVIIQIYKVHDWRFGHMVTNTQRTKAEIKDWNSNHFKKKLLIFFFGSNKSSNESYKNILMRQNISIQGHWGFLVFYLCSFFEFLVPLSNPQALDRLGLIIKYPAVSVLNKSEILEGKKFLESCKLGEENKYVCLNVRDSAYLSAIRNKDFTKHYLRNSNIRSYVDTARALTDLGFGVFRMGSKVEHRLEFEHPLFFDYATNGMRTEFLDIFLGANCAFCISTATGWDEIPHIFNRPTLYSNVLPLISPESLTRDLLLFPKYLRHKNTNKLLSLSDCFTSDLWGQSNPDWFDKYGAVVQDLSSDDLTHAAIEMAERVDGTFVETQEQKQMQAKLKHILSTHPKLQPTPNYYPIRAEFASCFLSRHPNFLDGFD